MTLPRLRSLPAAPMLWLALGFSAFTFLALPAGVVVMNDDFGYLGSVIETLQRGRPWTDDWLEPWSASLAGFSAVLWRITGSFLVAIQGAQALFAGSAAAGAFVLFRSRGLPAGPSAVVSLLALTFPAVLWKEIEYTSVALCLPCLLWAIWAAEQRRWGWFLVVWLIALASRQSALAWGAIPLGAALIGLRDAATRRASVLPAAVAMLGAVSFVALDGTINETQAQAMITNHLWSNARWATSLHHLAYGVGIGMVFAGAGAWTLGWSQSGLLRATPSLGRLLGVLLFGSALFTGFEILPRLFFEHDAFDGWSGLLYANLIVLSSLAAWLLFRFSIRWELVCASVGSLLLICLRTQVWDYYFMDIGIPSLFSAVPTGRPATADTGPRAFRTAGLALAAVLACAHGYFVFKLKCRVDRDYAVCVVTETALRTGALDVTRIGHAPYGFVGWHLHRHFAGTDGKQDADIGGFMRYQRPNATMLKFSPMRFWRDSRSLQPMRGADEPEAGNSEVFRVAWLWYQRCTLRRTPLAEADSARAFDDRQYRPRPFPLNDEEWRRHIDARP